MENQGTNEDDSQSDPHPEVGPSIYQSRHSLDSDTDEAPDNVTGVREGIRCRPHMVTETQQDIPYYSIGTSSGKQKKARSTSHPQFRNENTPCKNWSRPDFVGPSPIGDEQ